MISKYQLALGAATIALTSTMLPAAAQTQQYQFNVSNQSVGDGLRAIGSTANAQIVFVETEVAGKRGNAVRGAYTVQEALALFLDGTGLVVSVTPRGNYVVAASGTQHSALDEDSSAIPEILVRGSATLNADIRRTEDDVQPYQVYTSTDIRSSGATSVEGFLRNRMPMDAQGSLLSDGSAPTGDGARSSFNLRGLGSNQTLVLVNGRRLPGYSRIGWTDTADQADLNGIPLSAIERIEVLPSSASGIYGGGATGGVINVILKRDYNGLDVLTRYDNTFDGDAGVSRIDMSGGSSLEGGRTRVSFSAAYSQGNEQLVGDRSHLREAIALQLANNPAYFNTAPFIPGTANIFSTSGGNLILDDGTALGATRTYIPYGYAGVSSDGGAALVANAGLLNYDPANDVTGNRRSAFSVPERTALSFTISRDFTDDLNLFADVSYLSNASTAVGTLGLQSSFVLPGSAPGNPFQNNVRIRTPFPGYGPEIENESTILRSNLGAIYRLPGDWSVQAEYNWSISSNEFTYSTNAVSADFTAAINNGDIDLFRDVNEYGVDYSLLNDEISGGGPNEVVLEEASLRFGGPVFRLPAGSANASVLVSHRNEMIESSTYVAYQPDGSAAEMFYPDRSQEVTSVYAETLAPIFGGDYQVPGVQLLEAQLSARFESAELTAVPIGGIYVDPMTPIVIPDATTTSFEETNFTFGFRYKPIEDLTFRASYGTGFLPPSVAQIVPRVYSGYFDYFRDPLRDNIDNFYEIEYTGEGDPNLMPESSTSFSAGFIVEPRFLDGFRLSVDYTSIEKEDEITYITSQEIIDREDVFGDRITRGPNLPGDDPTWAGPIIALNAGPVNLFRSNLEALDISVEYVRPTERFGEFLFYALVTHTLAFERQYAANDEPLDSVGYQNGPLEWRGNFGLDWTMGPWTANWNAQYYDEYRLYTSTAPQSEIDRVRLNQGGDGLPHQIYHDARLSYRFGEGEGALSLGDTEISLGISNVFDEDSPVVAYSVGSSGVSQYYDRRGRRYTIAVRKSF